MITGQKNTGKSLFSTYILNNMLNNIKENQTIFYLETDLGQPNFGLPGFVSLFSFDKNEFQPRNCNLYRKPLIQFFLGEFSPQSYIKQYLNSIQKCIQFFNEFSYNNPLIVNTHGYLTNLGEILLFDNVKIIDPNFVLFLHEQNQQEITKKLDKQINNKLFKKRISFFKDQTLDQNRKDFLPILIQNFNNNKTTLNYKKKQIRDKLIIDHLTDNSQQAKFFSKLNFMQPFVAQIDIFKFLLLKGVDNQSFEVIQNTVDIAQTFIGSLVFFYENNDFKIDHNFIGDQPCLGLGFIKDFDLENNTIHIITQVEQEDREKIDIISKSRDIDFCNSFYTEHQFDSFKLSESLSQTHLMGSQFSTCINGKLLGSYKQKIA